MVKGRALRVLQPLRWCGVFEEDPRGGDTSRLVDHGTPGRRLPDWMQRERDAAIPPRYVTTFLEQLISGLANRKIRPDGMQGYVVEGHLTHIRTTYQLHITEDPKSPHLEVRLEGGEFRKDLVGKARVTGYVHQDVDGLYFEAKVVTTLSGARFSAGRL